ncbi:hypothetical protein OJ997_29740 [Solirubrobacter phytolaccae]|uniref:Uncharacterized protein n=1 Tax=Solirubrobacter phytolaccae TaxID=1404360 RepID=A0A9X3NG92_9ACTN|nr:hypothetical protein [Solirubrobacter phytolaccae]MDA0184522.1 hypothetical protein [Solirubrobacter phytolaccae]
MTTEAVIGVSVVGGIFLVGLFIWAKPRFEELQARRDEVGDRELPRRTIVRTLALGVLGPALALTVSFLGDHRDAAFIGGCALLFVSIAAMFAFLLRDAEAAQRRPVTGTAGPVHGQRTADR